MSKLDQKNILQRYSDTPLVGLINKKTNEIILAPCIPDKISVYLNTDNKVKKIYKIGDDDLQSTRLEITGEERNEYKRLLKEGFVPRVQFDAFKRMKSSHELLFELNQSGPKYEWGGFAVTFSSNSDSKLSYSFTSGAFNSTLGIRSRGATLNSDLQAKIRRQMDEHLKGQGQAQVRVVVSKNTSKPPEKTGSTGINKPHLIREIIEKMRENKKDIWVTDDKTQYFFRIDQSPAEPIFCTYEVRGNTLGHGMFGGVFKAQVLNAKTGEVALNQFIAIKELPEELFDAKEHKIASFQMRTGKIIRSEIGFNYIPLDFIDGTPIGDRKSDINKILEEMNEDQQLNFIIDLLMECNEMHKNFIHYDLKGDNILLQKISSVSGISYKAHIIDWGLAHPISSSLPPRMISPFAPLEAKISSTYGVFTDIYMISGILANILGYYQHSWIGTVNEWLFDKEGLKNLGFDNLIHECMTNYLNRMRGDYKDRPHKDEPLKFFLLLKQLKKLNQCSDQDKNISEQINIIKTRIYLLSQGFSEEKYNFFDQESCMKLAESKALFAVRPTIDLIWKPISRSSFMFSPKEQEIKEKKSDVSLSVTQLESEYKVIVKKIITDIEENKKLVSPQIKIIYEMAKKLEDKITFQAFKDFRHAVLVQSSKAENPSRYGSFYNKSPDYQIFESIKKMLASTLKKERQINASSGQTSIKLGSSHDG